MFTPSHLLPDRHFDKAEDYRDRWQSAEGQAVHNAVMGLLEDGAGEHFLSGPYERGQLSILEDSLDLRGIDIFGFEKEFPLSDNFKGIDFSFSSIYHSTFRGATFLSPVFRLVKFYNVHFVGCTFLHASFFGSTFEKTCFVGCDFIERDYFRNSEFADCHFEQCFFPENLFIDCKFDERTDIGEPRQNPRIPTASKLELNKKDLAEICKGIKDGYRAGSAGEKALEYFVKEKKAVTRYNTASCFGKASGYVLEFVTGYGVRPSRVLATMVVVFAAFWTIFAFALGDGQREKALLLSAGGFFTFGALTDVLVPSCLFTKVLYVAEAFLGVSLMATLITVLANRWFSDSKK